MVRFLLVLLALGLFSTPTQASTLTLEMLDVGQGDSLLIRTGGGKTVLIDAGEKKNDVAKMLTARKVTLLDMVVATHPHADHIGGMEAVLRGFEVKVYVDNGLPHTTNTYEGVMKAVEEKDITYRTAKAGQVYKLGSDAELEVLWPGEKELSGTRSDLNSNSVVLRLTHNKVCMLLTGDAEEPTEQAMIENGLKQCDILKVAHHGGNHSSSEAFLESLKPKTAIISVGTGNSYGHPGDETMARLKDFGVDIYRTDLSGTLQLISDGKTVQIVEGVQPASDEIASADLTAQAAEGGLIDINTASSSELTELPGIGPTKADAIVEYRKNSGPFKNVDDLANVKGIGAKTVDKLRSKATVGGGGKAAVNKAPDMVDPSSVPQEKGGGDGLININTASAEELTALPGIGKAKAEQIVEYRTTNGRFQSVDDLANVKGIGVKSVDKMRSKITVSGGGGTPVQNKVVEPVEGGSAPRGHDEPGRINVNTASASELTSLPGIGEGKGQKIVEEREQNGPFASCQDLTRVKGIGPKTIEKFEHLCTTQNAAD